MTETPAKTPRPIGKTWICFPGRAKAAAELAVALGVDAVDDAKAAAAAETEAAGMLEEPKIATSVGAAGAELVEVVTESEFGAETIEGVG